MRHFFSLIAIVFLFVSLPVFAGTDTLGLTIPQIEVTADLIKFTFCKNSEFNQVRVTLIEGEPYPLEWLAFVTREAWVENRYTQIIFGRGYDHDITRMLARPDAGNLFTIEYFNNGESVGFEEVNVHTPPAEAHLLFIRQLSDWTVEVIGTPDQYFELCWARNDSALTDGVAPAMLDMNRWDEFVYNDNRFYVRTTAGNGRTFSVNTDVVSGVNDDIDKKKDKRLLPQPRPDTVVVMPNPFNPVTTIIVSLSEPSETSLIIYNALGQEVATLINDRREAGEHRVQFNAAGLPSGVYFYHLTAGKFTAVNKMFLLK